MESARHSRLLVLGHLSRPSIHGRMAPWLAIVLIAALLFNAMACQMGDQHPMLAVHAETPAVQAVDVGEPLPSSPTAPLASERLTHHSQCVIALLVLSLLAVPLARSASIAVPPVTRLSQRTTAPLLPPP